MNKTSKACEPITQTEYYMNLRELANEQAKLNRIEEMMSAPSLTEDVVKNLNANKARVLKRMEQLQSATDSSVKIKRHTYRLRVPDYFPEIQDKLDTTPSRMAYIRFVLPPFVNDPKAKKQLLLRPELTPGESRHRGGLITTVDVESLGSAYPDSRGYKAYPLTFAMSDEELLYDWNTRLTSNSDGIVNSFRSAYGDSPFLNGFDDAVLFFIWDDLFEGLLPREDIVFYFQNRVLAHAEDKGEDRDWLKKQYTYRLHFNPEWYPGSGYLENLAKRSDVPTFLRWLVLKDMHRGEEIPYPKRRRNRAWGHRRKTVAGVTLSLVPGKDVDMMDWFDNRLWLKAYPDEWRWIRPDTRWRNTVDQIKCTMPKDWKADMNDEDTKEVVAKVYQRNHYTGLSFYIATLVYDYFHDVGTEDTDT